MAATVNRKVYRHFGCRWVWTVVLIGGVSILLERGWLRGIFNATLSNPPGPQFSPG